jgi:hypothetical protein
LWIGNTPDFVQVDDWLYLQGPQGSVNSWMESVGWNGYWDGTNWHFGNDGSNNGGAIVTGGIGGNWAVYIQASSGGTDQTVSDATLEANPTLYVQSNREVGINTNSPTQALDVNGKLHVATLATASATSICRNSNVLASCSSSIRYKENVKDSGLGLNELMRMRPVTFKWKGRDENDLGFIAEEMEKINPLFVTYENGQIEGVKYAQLTSVIVGGMKEQQGQIESLKTAYDSLSKQIDGLVAAIQAKLAAWLGDAKNGLNDLYASAIHAREVHSDKLCAKKSDGGEVCLTGDQLQKLLDMAADTRGGGAVKPARP